MVSRCFLQDASVFSMHNFRASAIICMALHAAIWSTTQPVGVCVHVFIDVYDEKGNLVPQDIRRFCRLIATWCGHKSA
jgi:hypothetical protein